MTSARHRGCEEVLRKLYDYLDREVDVLTATRIDGHLSKCIGCRELLRHQSRLLTAISHTARDTTDLECLRVRVRAALAGTIIERYH